MYKQDLALNKLQGLICRKKHINLKYDVDTKSNNGYKRIK